jgi:hypothetical protein
MEQYKVQAQNQLITLPTGLTLVFAAAKVFGFINWSWLWVLSPLWISLGFVIGVFLLVLLIACITAVALKVLDR